MEDNYKTGGNCKNYTQDNLIKKLFKLSLEVPKRSIDLLTIMITKIYDFIIPMQKSIVISLIILGILSFLQTRATIFLIETLSFYTNLSTSFLGMTLISWGNNVGDSINAAVAARLGKVDLLISSILGTQILNLQICLGFPWFISTLTTPGLQILIADTNTFKFFATVFFVVLATILSFSMFGMKLHRISGFVLVIIYLVYITYEFKNNINIY
jgi:Ca2+/Na+ antiporter